MLSRTSTSCDDCALAQDRRLFLRQAASALGGVFVALGLSSEAARALGVQNLSNTFPRTSQGTTHSYQIPDKDSVQIDKDNQVILVRWLDIVYAFSLACPHQNTALTWLSKEEHFQCPKHRSQYSADGYFITGRATRGMDRYAITRSDKDKNVVIVDLGMLKKESDNKNAWEAACVRLS